MFVVKIRWEYHLATQTLLGAKVSSTVMNCKGCIDIILKLYKVFEVYSEMTFIHEIYPVNQHRNIFETFMQNKMLVVSELLPRTVIYL